MSKPFHFPTEYGKLGNWPGTLRADQAQTILMHALNQRQGAKFVELGFDGGRTTVCLHWAAIQIGAEIDVVSVADPEAALWLKRAQILFKMQNVKGHAELKPFPCDLLVINVGVPSALPILHDWYAMVVPGGSVVALNGTVFSGEKIATSSSVAIYVKPKSNTIAKVIDNVVKELSPGSDNGDLRAKVRSLRDGKKRTGSRDGADPKVHEGLDADQGAELQQG